MPRITMCMTHPMNIWQNEVPVLPTARHIFRPHTVSLGCVMHTIVMRGIAQVYTHVNGVSSTAIVTSATLHWWNGKDTCIKLDVSDNSQHLWEVLLAAMPQADSHSPQ